MSPEEVQALLAENAALRAEVPVFRLQVAELTQQLQAALIRIAELEQAQAAPPPFVKPNRPQPPEPKGPRRKRAAAYITLPRNGCSRRGLSSARWHNARTVATACAGRALTTPGKCSSYLRPSRSKSSSIR